MARVKTPDIPPLVKLLCEDRRYKLEAYQFVRAGLNYAQEVLGLGKRRAADELAEASAEELEALEETDQPRPRHVNGQDLCVALKQLAHEQYGLMAKLVLNSWGIYSTSDFGEIVYNLIKIGEMTKSEGDRRSDFDNVFDFDQALVRDFAVTRQEA